MLVAGVLVVAAIGRLAAQRGISRDTYQSQMSQALDGIESSSRRARTGSRPRVHANLFLAHEAFIADTPLSVLKRAVDAFKEAGVAQVDLNMGLFPWVSKDAAAIEKYDEVVRHIRASGMQVAINPQYSPLRHKVKDLAEWRSVSLPIYGTIAERYKPETFVVVHEPTTMSARMRSRATPEEWAAYAREATRIVKERSPKSRIGAGGLDTEERYYNAFAELPEIDVMTLDIYNLRNLPTFQQMVQTAKKRGKGVYIEETWRPPYFTRAFGQTLDRIAVKNVGDRSFEDLDVKWIRTIAAWAAANGVEAITPVWMQTFFTYGGTETEAFDPAYLKAVNAAIERGERTRTFNAIRDLSR